jgi:hypothetical protein
MGLSVSSLVFELALIFIPGFIWMKIHCQYGYKGEKKQFDLILNTFIFGVLSYAILYAIYRLFGSNLRLFDLDAESKKLIQPEIFPEIFYAAIIAVIGGIVTLYIENYKLFTTFVQRIRATNTFGDEDVWDYTFNSRTKSADFVHFRDLEQRVTYAGIVQSFSETGRLRELVLDQVIVYDFDGNEMYKVPRLYLARPPEHIHIEFPIDQEGNLP